MFFTYYTEFWTPTCLSETNLKIILIRKPGNLHVFVLPQLNLEEFNHFKKQSYLTPELFVCVVIQLGIAYVSYVQCGITHVK